MDVQAAVAQEPALIERPWLTRRRETLILLAILIIAALARTLALTAAPPGLNQDEATNAWNAWCLLKTGKDQVGVAWPIFYAHALGGNHSTLFMYYLIPFEAVGGLNIWTFRFAAVGAFVVGIALTLGPLGWKHVTDPQGTGKHWQYARGWAPTDPFWTKVTKVAKRYPPHFGPDFLFRHGVSIRPAIGSFYWYDLASMLAGLVVLVPRFRRSRGARIVLVAVVLYPVGDILTNTDAPHGLRALPGLPALVLLMAAGAAGVGEWLWRRNPVVTMAVGAALLPPAAQFGLDVGARMQTLARQPATYHTYQVDILEAARWLKPRLDRYDAVLFTTSLTNQPYIITLIGFNYDPRRWLDDPREFYTPDEWDRYVRYGKIYFLFTDHRSPELDAMNRELRACL